MCPDHPTARWFLPMNQGQSAQPILPPALPLGLFLFRKSLSFCRVMKTPGSTLKETQWSALGPDIQWVGVYLHGKWKGVVVNPRAMVAGRGTRCPKLFLGESCRAFSPEFPGVSITAFTGLFPELASGSLHKTVPFRVLHIKYWPPSWHSFCWGQSSFLSQWVSCFQLSTSSAPPTFEVL